MVEFHQPTHTFTLKQEPRNNGPFTDPTVSVQPGDKLEIVGPETVEKKGNLTIAWVQVKGTKGTGFAKTLSLQPFVEGPPPDDKSLPPERRESVEFRVLAQWCYRNAIHYGSNSALLLALAFSATGSQWTADTAKAADSGGRRGIYAFAESEWNAALARLGAQADVRPDQIATARAQCEVAGFLTGEAWKTFGDDARAIDLYVAFLTNADIAMKLGKADDKATLSQILTTEETKIVSDRMTSVIAGTISPETTKAELIKALVAKFDTALGFVRAFAEDLVADNVPTPDGQFEKTENEIDHEDPIDGEDGPIGPDSPIVAPDIPKPPAQPTDGTLLVSEAHLVALWKRSLFPVDGRGIILFGLRGCLPVDSSGTDFAASHKVRLVEINYRRMRCTIGQWRPGKGFALFPGSTVPFVELVETAKKNGGDGVNQMGRGRYKNYVPGRHKRRDERKKQHSALLQECDISFQRTADDLPYDPDDRWDAGRPGDNLHCAFHMGESGKFEESQYSSAGCQVVAGRVAKGKKGSEEGPWKKFIESFLGDIEQSGCEYVLFDGRELERMIRTEMAGETVVLRMGSEGAPVADLQQRLGLADPDGKFGPNTFRAVIKFQHQNFAKSADDGIVGAQTAQRLGLVLPKFVFADAVLGLSAVASGPTPGSGTGAAGEGLCWGKVTDQLHGPAFKQKVREISGRLGCNPNHLMAVMAFESGRTFSPKVKNPLSSATGLIQFMANTAIGLGTTTAKLAKMTAIAQLDFVEKHLRPHAGRMKTVSDIYMAVLRPASVGKPENEVLFRKGSKAYKDNSGLDTNKDGMITKKEAAAKVVEQLNLGLTKEHFG